ncbi:ubiquinone-binding protein [Kordiimonas sediminis]|uniref:Ubiquinone-binding protein n=1 Tax=Kordiimonas sediminis TaxID=1735581 RepID=A0A919AVB8_9PROT|nr:type II toxin-antitoxin system RatA family toxin [Kordiimonas sediminis]GHF28285.1 ubiquinone-binding protein [Kordiimonas sediminis]
MPQYSEQRTLPFSAEQLFDLVSDVREYPKFLPWCEGARIYNQKEGQFDADLIIGFKMFKERFTSRVTTDKPTKVYVDYIRGPMKELYNHWHFIPQPDGSCVIDFDVRFQFKSALLDKLIGTVFAEATQKMIGAFEKRAYELYGDPVV